MAFADLTLRPEAKTLLQNHLGGRASDRTSAQAVFHKTDVSSWKDLSDVYEKTKSTFGGIDIVCPGAGVFEPPWSSFWRPPGREGTSIDIPTGNGYKSLDINLVHPIRLTQLAIEDHIRESRSTKKTGRKTVIHVSSVNGQVAPLWTPLYNASKHALNGFVRTLGPLEKRWKIRVAAVAPGLVKTPLWTDNTANNGPLSAAPAWVTAEEVAQVMLEMVEKDAISSCLRPTGKDSEQEGRILVRGGSVIEVSGSRVRDVQAFNDPGPQGISPQDFNVAMMEESVFTRLEEEQSIS